MRPEGDLKFVKIYTLNGRWLVLYVFKVFHDAIEGQK